MGKLRIEDEAGREVCTLPSWAEISPGGMIINLKQTDDPRYRIPGRWHLYQMQPGWSWTRICTNET